MAGRLRFEAHRLVVAAGELELVRLAAFIDGEGSINTSRAAKSGRSVRVQVSISGTDFRLARWLKSTFGGSVSHIRPSKPHCKPAFIWMSSCMHAEVILRRVLPYLLLKREQADLALAIRETFQVGRNQTKPIVGAIADRREELASKIRVLNHRGVA